WTSSLLLRLECLTGITSVYDHQQLICIDSFNCQFQLLIRDTMFEDHLESYGIKRVSLAGVTKVVRQQIKPLPMRCSMSRKVDKDGIFWLRCFQLLWCRRSISGNICL